MNTSYQLERTAILESVKAISNDTEFWDVAKEVYGFQLKYNVVFSEYLTHLNRLDGNSSFYFLPISFYKTHTIKTGIWTSEKVFTSSGTASQIRSKHHVKLLSAYNLNARMLFEQAYGSVADYCFLCLLPSYLERDGSSLIDMCADFIEKSRYSESGFYLYNHDDLNKMITDCEAKAVPTVLLGVSYALLDFAENYKYESLKDVKVMKTGGMKGKRKELHVAELDEELIASLGVDTIHAEYGMTECLSQMYSCGKGYQLNNRMKVVISDISDPFSVMENGRTGRINIVDLANIDSCSFIATDDIGYINHQGLLEVLGRIDNSDLRGCNLLL